MSALLEEIEQHEAWEFRPIQGGRGGSYRLELQLEETADPNDEEGEMSTQSASLALFAPRAHACGRRTRTFSAVASACSTIHETKLPVRAKVKLYHVGAEGDERVFDQELSGELVAEGLVLSTANVALQLSQPDFNLSITSEFGRPFTLHLVAAVVGNQGGGIVPLN
jgi:hypothetical protein